MEASRSGSLIAAGLAAAMLAFFPASSLSAQSGSQELALIWYKQARDLAVERDWKAALGLLEEAKAIDGTNSDLRYLSAKLLLESGASAIRVIAELDAALAADRFSDFTREQAILMEAEVSVRIARFARALELLMSLTPSERSSADAMMLQARSLRGLGREGDCLTLVELAFAAFPGDPRFPRLFLESNGKTAPDQRSRKLGDILLGRLPSLISSDPELAVLATAIMPGQEERKAAILSFRSRGGRSSLATLRALEYGIIDEVGAASELFSDVAPPRATDLNSALALARNDQGRRVLLDAAATWMGELETEGRGIGYALLSAGLVKSWRLDRDGAGELFLNVVFIDGLPSSCELERAGGTRVSYRYSKYPRLGRVTYHDTSAAAGIGGDTSYDFGPDGPVYGPLQMKSLGGQGSSSIFLPVGIEAEPPTQRELVANALSLRKDLGPTSWAITRLLKGIPQKRETWTDGKLGAILVYSGGRPGIEKVDSDGDGRFETERSYDPNGDGGQDGIIGFRVDSRGSGRFDYSEMTRFPFKKEWDFDGNGSMDASQESLADGSTKTSFSSRLDGRFDQILISREGLIVSLARNGLQESLIQDANPLVTWIGKKPFDLGPSIPGPGALRPPTSGVYMINGSRVLLLWVNGHAFAEMVQ